jgi:hypothetical protein
MTEVAIEDLDNGLARFVYTSGRPKATGRYPEPDHEALPYREAGAGILRSQGIGGLLFRPAG